MIELLILLILILYEVSAPYIILYCFLVLLYKYLQRRERIEPFTLPQSYLKTKDPVNNIMLNDLPLEEKIEVSEEDKKRVQNYIAKNSETSMKQLYYENIFRPVEDYFDKKNGYRQFYTIPDVSGFIDRIYRDMPSCKDNPEYCFSYRDIRHK